MTWGKRKDGQAYNKDKKGMSGSKMDTKPTSDIHLKAKSLKSTEGDFQLPNIYFSHHNWGMDIEDGKIKRVRLGNWSDSGWHWDGDESDLGEFIVRLAGTELDGEFIDEMEKENVTFGIFKEKLIKAVKNGSGIYALSGDNVRWRFGENEPDLEGWVDGIEGNYDPKQILEKMYDTFHINYEEFEKKYGDKVKDILLSRINESDDYKSLLSNVSPADKVDWDIEELYSQYQTEKLMDAEYEAREEIDKEKKSSAN